MYVLLPYFWMLFIASAVIATIVAALLGRPKRAPKAAATQPVGEESPNAAEPAMDFGDELAQMEQK
jgi:hypothetical protein